MILTRGAKTWAVSGLMAQNLNPLKATAGFQ
jgi:hypothetical protein